MDLVCCARPARLVALSLLSLAVAAPASRASGMTYQIEYSTTVSIGTAGLTGPPVVDLQGVSDGTFRTDGSPFLLASPVISPSAGSDSTYASTPFDISLVIKSVAGMPSFRPVVFDIPGTLYGKIQSTDASNLNLFLYTNNFSFSNRDQYILPIPKFTIGEGRLAQVNPFASTDGGRTYGNKDASVFAAAGTYDVVPEPTAAWSFLAVGLLGLMRKLRRA